MFYTTDPREGLKSDAQGDKDNALVPPQKVVCDRYVCLDSREYSSREEAVRHRSPNFWEPRDVCCASEQNNFLAESFLSQVTKNPGSSV